MPPQSTPKPTPFDQLPVAALSDEQASTISGGIDLSLIFLASGTSKPQEFAQELAVMKGR